MLTLPKPTSFQFSNLSFLRVCFCIHLVHPMHPPLPLNHPHIPYFSKSLSILFLNPAVGVFSPSRSGVLFALILPVRAAQRLHLIPAAPPPLSDDEWHLVKERSAHRRDFQRPCAICKEELGIRSQVLLSCSHTFHKICLQAFEHFSGKKCCPLCCHEEYQARVVHEGTHWYRARCATRIQALWRGYLCRRQYKHKILALFPKDMSLQRKLHEEKVNNGKILHHL
uniref:RING-type domain-containing protein n=1 Tax=Eptatretus burgeri TaxID=7764 RepID=A0A8C4QPX1_EPTBU